SAGHAQVQVTVSGATGIAISAGTEVPVVYLVANVPSGTALGRKAVLDLQSVTVNGSAATAGNGLDVNAYFGNVTGTGSFVATDATRVAQVAAQVNQNAASAIYSGFASLGSGVVSFQNVDPVILADVRLHAGVVNAQDGTLVSQKDADPTNPA